MKRLGLGAVSAVLLAAVVACSSAGSTGDRAGRSTTSTTTRPVVVEAAVPAVPAGTKDCGTLDGLAGWPTTTVSTPDAFACIIDALAAGTPAQMASITASDGDNGRTTGDGFAIPTRRIVTWVVKGKGVVEETTDRTEDGGSVTTRTCAAFTEATFAVPIAGTDCTS